MYWLDFNGSITEEVLENIDIEEEKLEIEEAINNAKEIIKRSGVSFCTCAIMFSSFDGDEDVRGWVNFNSAFDKEPQWKECQ